MAELLVMLQDRTHPDPGKDTLLPKRGDVVAVKPDGWAWGTKEGPPLFGVIEVTDRVAEQVKHLQGPLTEPNGTVNEAGDLEADRVIRRRRYMVDIDGALPNGVRNALERGDAVQRNARQLGDALVDRGDGGTGGRVEV